MSSHTGVGVWAGLVAAGALAMSVSPFLPWVTASVAADPEQAGLESEEGDRGAEGAEREATQTGRETTVPTWIAIAAGAAGLVAAGLMVAGRVPAGARLGGIAAVAGAVTAWRGYRYAQEPETLIFLRDDSPVELTVGGGLWVLMGGTALVLLACTVAGLRARPR
jgi:hypothetical protein